VTALVVDEAKFMPTRRGRGRPREADLGTTILEAAIDELCVLGVGGLTFDRLALVSGVAKTTIYRRWASKTQLIIDAIDLLRSSAPVVNSGNVRADLERSLDNMLQVFASPRGRAIAAVFMERRFNQDLAVAWQAKISGPHRAGFEEIIMRGIANGELKPTVNEREIQDLLTGVAFGVLLGEGRMSPGLAARTVDALLGGIAASTDRHVRGVS
jgi:AcrR family transcriptional regulator